MNKIEILAPVGGEEQLVAAVRCGANAVYMGLQGFNARQNAKNFAVDSLSKVVEYCHQRNVKVHITLNTLVFDEEIKTLVNTVEKIAMCGVDAVIVQDLATAKIIRDCCPLLPMHASTQMTIHNSAGVEMASKLGFSRVVLARELTFDEICDITKKSSIETEVFVHGALCTSVSGTCYLSAMLGGRSGNRGYCAQPCRLNFQNSFSREYALSLKDMSLIENAGKLANAGVASLKIEGRMKRPEYVAASVTALNAALNGEKYDVKLLEKVFSRSGFTDGYFTGKRNISMYGYRRKEDVAASSEALGEISSLYRCERQCVKFDAEMVLKKDCTSCLMVTDGSNYVTVEGDVPEIAQKISADGEYIRKSLSKTGGTPFILDNLITRIDKNITLASSKINAMRKQALEKLLDERGTMVPYEFYGKNYEVTPRITNSNITLRFRFEKAEQMVDSKYADKIILPIDEIIGSIDKLKCVKNKLIAEIPPILWEKESFQLSCKFKVLKEYGIDNIVCSNIGALQTALDNGMIIHGDYGLNITNSIALEEYGRLGIQSATISFESGVSQISKLGGKIERGIIAYGYLPLMKLRTCPAQSKNGCMDCDGRPFLTDRMGTKFPLLCKNKRYTELLNSVPLYVGDKVISGVNFKTLYFTTENKKDIENVINIFGSSSKYPKDHTNGLYFRGVK